MREFQQFSVQENLVTNQQLEQMANKLAQQRQSRSGLFQFSDLSHEEAPIEPPTEEQDLANRQPEEEPIRRRSQELIDVSRDAELAQETPIPDSPITFTVDQ